MFFKYKDGKQSDLFKRVMSILCSVFLIASTYPEKLQKVEAADNDTATKGKYLKGITINATVGTSYDSLYNTTFYNTIKSNYDAGYSNAADALKISTAGELAAFAKLVNEGSNFSGKYVSLTSNIDLKGVKPTVSFNDNNGDTFSVEISNPDNESEIENAWVPIGSSDTIYFAGRFDGGGHVISNMVVVNKSESYVYAGLFGYVQNGEIKNVGVKESIVVSSSSSEASSGGIAGVNISSMISNCYNTGDVYSSANSYSYSGGIAGYNSYSTISNCYNIGDVYSYSTISSRYSAYSGGIASYNNHTTISNCYNTGNVYSYSSSTTPYYYPASSGGIAGYNYFSTISNCYNTGYVSSFSSYSAAYSGGIAGYNYVYSTISSCYNTGYITSSSSSSDYYSAYSGGIAAYNDSTISNCCNTGDVFSFSAHYSAYSGGIAGKDHDSSINNCYSTGTVAASSIKVTYLGGICGHRNEGKITNCYYDTERGKNICAINGKDYDSDYVQGLSTAEMQGEAAKTNMAGFANTTNSGIKVWSFEKDKYPLLNILVSKIKVLSFSRDRDKLKVTTTQLDYVDEGPHAPVTPAELLYVWTKDGEKDETKTGSKYDVTSNDNGSVISCTLTAINYIGSYTYSATISDPNLTIEKTDFISSDIDFSTVSVDKSDWGREEPYEGGVTNYVADDGTTSAEVDKYGMIWLKETSGEKSAWYGIDNTNGIFELGSRFWVRWLSKKVESDAADYATYYGQLDDKDKVPNDSGRVWIFLVGVTDPNGNEYKDFHPTLPLYIQIKDGDEGDGWKKEEIQARFIKKWADEIVKVESKENVSYPEGKGEFAVLTLEHFSPYAIYDKDMSSNVTGDDGSVNADSDSANDSESGGLSSGDGDELQSVATNDVTTHKFILLALLASFVSADSIRRAHARGLIRRVAPAG